MSQRGHKITKQSSNIIKKKASTMSETIKLVSGTDQNTGKSQTFEVGVNVAKLSSTVETAIKKDDNDEDDNDEEYLIPADGIDLPKVPPQASTMSETIKLVSGTDQNTGKSQTFEVGVNVAKLSSTVETAIKKDDNDEDDNDEEYLIPADGIDLPKVPPQASTMSETIKLVSGTDQNTGKSQTFEVGVNVAKLSSTVETAIKKDDNDEDDNDEEYLIPADGIDLPKVPPQASTMSETIKLVSGTDQNTGKSQTFEVGVNVAKLSSTVETAIKKDDNDEDDNDEEYLIPADGVDLPKVPPQVLERVVSFCQHHVAEPMNEIPKPMKKELNEYVQEWYMQFLDQMDEYALADIIMAANYMDVRPLMNLTCAKVAIIIRDMSPKQIREKYNIENDFTPEEEEKLEIENKWRDHKK